MSAVMCYVLLIGLTYRIVEIQYPLRKEYEAERLKSVDIRHYNTNEFQQDD